MIRTGELRVGNIVKCKVSNDASFYEVLALDGWHLKIMLDGVRKGVWYPEEKIKPIQLTEKILLRFGFEKSLLSNNYWHIAQHKSFCLKLGKDIDETLTPDLFYLEEYLVPVYNLHQLQNLYFTLRGGGD